MLKLPSHSMERAENRSLRIPKRAGTVARGVAAVGIALGGACGVINYANAEGNAESFKLVCTDSSGDVKPKSVDILKVETSKNQENTYSRFNLAGSVSTKDSIIGPESAFGVAFIDVDGLSRAILQVKGAPNTEEVVVMLEQLRVPIKPNDKNMPTPVESDSILETFGVENVKVDETGTIVTFSIPSEFIDQFSTNVVAFSNISNGDMPTVEINGDTCQVEPEPTPTRVSETSSTVLAPKPTETPAPTPGVGVSLPDTGDGKDEGSGSKVVPLIAWGFSVGAFTLGLGLSVASAMNRIRKRK